MKNSLLLLLIITLSCPVISAENPTDAVKPFNGNIKAFGYYGSGRLPVGYQFFMGYEHIGKLRTSMGIQLINQFSSGANHDLSGTIFRKNTLLNHGKFSDLMGYNVRMRKLQFTETPIVLLNQKAWYTIIFNNRYSIGAGYEYMEGTENNYGLLLNGGKYFPATRLSCNVTCSFMAGNIDYKTTLSKSVSFGKSSPTNYGLEVSFENFRGYKDVSLGILMYL